MPSQLIWWGHYVTSVFLTRKCRDHSKNAQKYTQWLSAMEINKFVYISLQITTLYECYSNGPSSLNEIAGVQMWENTKLDTLKSCFKQGSTPLIVRTRAKKWVNHWIITLQLIPLVGACQSFFKNKVTATTAIRKLPTRRSCSHQVIPKLQSVRSEPHERHCFMVLCVTNNLFHWSSLTWTLCLEFWWNCLCWTSGNCTNDAGMNFLKLGRDF